MWLTKSNSNICLEVMKFRPVKFFTQKFLSSKFLFYKVFFSFLYFWQDLESLMSLVKIKKKLKKIVSF